MKKQPCPQEPPYKTLDIPSGIKNRKRWSVLDSSLKDREIWEEKTA